MSGAALRTIAGTKPITPATNMSFNMPNSTVYAVVKSYVRCDLGSMCIKERRLPSKDLTETICYVMDSGLNPALALRYFI